MAVPKPRVLNKKNVRRAFNGIYVGRPSKWGNPFVIGRDGSRQRVIDKFEDYLLGNEALINDLHELKGKDLICWCAPLACHADILLRYANGGE